MRAIILPTKQWRFTVSYEIIRFKDGYRWDGSEHFKGLPLSSGQDHARLLVETKLAQRVEIREAGSNKLLFQWPRALRAGSNSVN